jgi:D-glycero-D-manno-heptose 1,7-bisphosphate phosphatase
MPPPAERPAVFLDRDGVLNDDGGYLYRTSDVTLIAGAAAAVAELARRGFLILVISNQSGVARGRFGTGDVERFNATLDRALRREGGAGVDGFYYCPHLPKAPEATVPAWTCACDCRKPAPGMVLKAARDHRVALGRSFLVGDKPEDVECAVRAGVRGIQVTAPGRPPHPQALAQVASLAAALPLLR